MLDQTRQSAEKYTKINKRRKYWHKIVMCMAAIVVFCTTYALILPAITMSRNNPQLAADETDAAFGESLKLSIDAETENSADTVFYISESRENAGIDLAFNDENIAKITDKNGRNFDFHREIENDGTVGYWFVLSGTDDEAQITLPCINGVGKFIKTTYTYTVEKESSSATEIGNAASVTETTTENTPSAEGEETETDGDVSGTDNNLPAQTGAGESASDPDSNTASDEQTGSEESFDNNADTGHRETETVTETKWDYQNGNGGAAGSVTFAAGCGDTLENAKKAAKENGDKKVTLSWTADAGKNKAEELTVLIDTLPTTEEIEARFSAFEEAGDEQGYNDYYTEILMQARYAYALYEDAGVDVQELVTNRDKLLDLAWLWSADTLEITDTLTVYQINKYSQAVVTLVNGGSVKDKLGNGMSFTYWDVIVVEKNSSGKLYVANYVTADGDKRSYKASTTDGFVLLVYNKAVNVAVGQDVTVDFNYKTTGAYKSTGYGTVSFGSDAELKPDKDNTGKLSVVQGVDTRKYIEINLYDYGDNINSKYDSDKSYPGFQQDNGTKKIDSDLTTGSFNFGNNITSDLRAGDLGVTRGSSGINATVNGANSPISGAIKSTLGDDGYPALSNGSSLGYLFSNNVYATKKNGQSINGLFLYDDVTGAYHFNSRENHAQFNEGTDTFTLYNQIISPNFMMYPFGNFLPFNDIVHESAQASMIDRAYFQTLASSAQYKYSNGYGDEYGTLATQLKSFIALMDRDYPDGWTGADCTNKYFELAGIDARFTSDDAHMKRLYSIDFDEPTDFYFGMEMKMNFMQPKNGMTGKDTNHDGASDYPMVFYFAGDDDVWVYIDGTLFLDLSGIHRHVGGEIDFVKGEVRYYDLDISTGDVSTVPSKTVKFSEIVGADGLNGKGTFKDYSSHAFNFYYMERGSGSGVCRMNFNFPLLKENTISVTKELSSDEEELLKVLGNPDFRFQVLKAGTSELFIGAGVEYDILDAAGNNVGTGVTDANGIFTLKANQTAVFDKIEENEGRYHVRELLDKNVFEQYGTIYVDGSSQTTSNEIVVGEDTFHGVDSPIKDMSDGNTVFHFNNQITFKKLGSLSVTKTLTEYPKARAAQQFEFEVALDGAKLPVGTEYTVESETRTVAEEGIIILAPDETAVISNILAGSKFTVRETGDLAENYTVSYKLNGEAQSGDGVSGVIKTAEKAEVIVNNSERGTSAVIPIEKILTKPDGEEHSYVIKLEQVTDETGKAYVEPAFSRELTINIKDSAVSEQFELGYPQNELETLPQSFYYKITEKINADDMQTVYDKSVYIVKVTVKDDGGEITAGVTNVWKDGTEMKADNGDTPKIIFENQIVTYLLPQTGGNGTEVYTVGGSLITAATVVLMLLNRRKHRKEDVGSS